MNQNARWNSEINFNVTLIFSKNFNPKHLLRFNVAFISLSDYVG